jgi:hypothetical protein
VTGRAWEHQREGRETLRAIVPGSQSGAALPRTPEAGADREVLARTLRHPPAGPAPAPMDDSIP